MTKEELLGSICLADAINECCSEDANSDTSCEKCELEMSIMLDKFAKQIRADAIEEYRKEMHDMIDGNEEFTDWQKYEILECNELVAEQLKEQNK